MEEMAAVDLCSWFVVLGLWPGCPCGLGEQRDVKKNQTSPSLDFGPSLKPWDLP